MTGGCAWVMAWFSLLFSGLVGLYTGSFLVHLDDAKSPPVPSVGVVAGLSGEDVLKRTSSWVE